MLGEIGQALLANKAAWVVIILIVLRYAESYALATKTDVDNKIVAALKEFFTLDFFKK